MVPQPPPDNPFLRDASCIIGLTLAGHAMIQAYDAYVNGLDEPLLPWAVWVGLEGLGGALTLNECWQTWVADRDSIPMYYLCDAHVQVYPFAHDENTILNFTTKFLCDGSGFAFYPVNDFVN